MMVGEGGVNWKEHVRFESKKVSSGIFFFEIKKKYCTTKKRSIDIIWTHILSF